MAKAVPFALQYNFKKNTHYSRVAKAVPFALQQKKYEIHINNDFRNDDTFSCGTNNI
jgi:hypothetical protein